MLKCSPNSTRTHADFRPESLYRLRFWYSTTSIILLRHHRMNKGQITNRRAKRVEIASTTASEKKVHGRLSERRKAISTGNRNSPL